MLKLLIQQKYLFHSLTADLNQIGDIYYLVSRNLIIQLRIQYYTVPKKPKECFFLKYFNYDWANPFSTFSFCEFAVFILFVHVSISLKSIRLLL